MEARRGQHTATPLPSGKVLLAGGSGQSWMSGNTADLYDLAAIPALTTTSVPDGQVGVPYPATTLAAAGGAGAPYQIAIVPGTLAPGLAFNAGTLRARGHANRHGCVPGRSARHRRRGPYQRPVAADSRRQHQRHHEPLSADRRRAQPRVLAAAHRDGHGADLVVPRGWRQQSAAAWPLVREQRRHFRHTDVNRLLQLRSPRRRCDRTSGNQGAGDQHSEPARHHDDHAARKRGDGGEHVLPDGGRTASAIARGAWSRARRRRASRCRPTDATPRR